MVRNIAVLVESRVTLSWKCSPAPVFSPSGEGIDSINTIHVKWGDINICHNKGRVTQALSDPITIICSATRKV